MGFDWGSFAGGIGQGMQTGADIRRKMLEREQQLQQMRAQSARAQGLMQRLGGMQPMDGQGGAPPSQGAGPAAPPAAAPASAAPPVAAPMGAAPAPAPMGGQGAPQPIPGARPMPPGVTPPGMARPPVPGQAGPAAPQGPAGPAAGPPAAPPGTAGSQGGAQQANQDPDSPLFGIDLQKVGQDWQQIKKTADQHYLQVAQTIMAGMKASGKKVDPVALMMAADDQVKADDALDPMLKQIMLSESQNNRLQMQFVMGQKKLSTTERGQDLRYQAQQDAIAQRMQAASEAHTDRQARNAIYAEATGWSHEDRQFAIQSANERGDKQIASKMEMLDKAIEDRDWQTVARLTAQEDIAANREAGSVYRAQVGAGQKAAVPKPIRTPLPARGGSAGSGMTKQDIAASIANARTALKSHPDQRAAILKRLQDAGISTQGL